jgi:hypothetical protein
LKIVFQNQVWRTFFHISDEDSVSKPSLTHFLPHFQ